MEENRNLSEAELLKIKDAAKEGAKEGAQSALKGVRMGSGILSSLLGRILTIVVLVCVALAALNSINPLSNLKKQLGFGKPVEGYDLTLENNGIFGFKAADFAEAVLGRQDQLKKIEVMSQKVSDVMTQTDAGFINLEIFTKSQLITYNGTAIYTVDLSKMKERDFLVNEDARTVTVYIPEPELDEIVIRAKDIKVGEVDRGILAFGEIKNTK